MNIDNLKESIVEIIKLQEYKLMLVQEEIEFVIENNIKDNNEIEHLLDDLLDVMFIIYNDNVVDLYRKLCAYYYNLNPKSSIYYLYLSYKEHTPKENMKTK